MGHLSSNPVSRSKLGYNRRSRITLPAWTQVEYSFLTQELIEGSEPGTWEGNDDYELTTSQRDHQTIKALNSIDLDSP